MEVFSPLFARPPDSTFSADSGSHFGAHLRGPFSEPEPAEAESSCGSAQQAPFPEPEKGFHFGSKISSNQGINFGRCESGVCANFDAKVTLFWRRADWLESKVPDGRVPMWVNLDETAVNYSYHSAKGLVSSLAWQKKPQLLVPKRDRRGTIAHIALLSNVVRVQQHLPQVLVCNKRRLTRSLLAQLNVAKPDNVWIFRRASFWNTTDIMQWIIQMIGHVFRTKLAGLGFQPRAHGTQRNQNCAPAARFPSANTASFYSIGSAAGCAHVRAVQKILGGPVSRTPYGANWPCFCA